MSAISQIRSIIQDSPLYAKESVDLDGIQLSLQLYYFPTIGSTVIITPPSGPPPSFTFDESNGVLTFGSAPTAGTYILEYSHVNLLDATIQDFIDVEGSDVDVRLPAADALDAIASSQALIQKNIQLLDLKTDGKSLADALRAHANTLRQQVFDPKFQESTFDIAEQINDKPGFREKVIKDWMRQGL